jgi:hypothetical protein
MGLSIGRVCLLLAGSDLRRTELKSFFHWVESVGPVRASEYIAQLRDLADSGELWPGRIQEMRIKDARLNAGRYSEIADKIEELLLSESGLTKMKATEFLANELRREIPKDQYLPEPGRNSFRAWVEKLCEELSPSLLLHVVTRLRNKLAHQPKTDWPLGKE